jgi:2-methylcitrate dehydratase PrpD
LARGAAKTFILDSLAVGVAGARAPYADEILRVARRWGVADVGAHAHVLGRRERLPPASAAFVNGFQIHCQEFDCVHEPAVVHPMATIFAALAATCEGRRKISGEELVAATALGVDVSATLGVASKSAIRYFRPATAGVFGATLSTARLLGFDLHAALDALGYALAHCSGTMQAHREGKPALPVQIANAARAAIVACDIAQERVPGPHDVIEGPFGYMPLFEGEFDLEKPLSELGRIWRVAEVSHKPFPTGRAAQGGLIGIMRLRGEGLALDNLESLVLTAPPLIKRLVGRAPIEGMSVNYARLCFPFLGAVAMTRDVVGLSDFDATTLGDSALLAAAARIRVESDGSIDPAAFTPQRLDARLTDGRSLSTTVKALFGSPADPLSPLDQRAKVRSCIEFGMKASDARARADEIIERVSALEREPDAGSIIRLAAGL